MKNFNWNFVILGVGTIVFAILLFATLGNYYVGSVFKIYLASGIVMVFSYWKSKSQENPLDKKWMKLTGITLWLVPMILSIIVLFLSGFGVLRSW